jgi:hypothetical protein
MRQSLLGPWDKISAYAGKGRLSGTSTITTRDCLCRERIAPPERAPEQFFDEEAHSFLGRLTCMAARFHVLVQYADNLNQIRCDRAVVDDVHGLFHFGLQVVRSHMPHMKATDTAHKIIWAMRRATFRIVRHLAHRHRDQRYVPSPALGAPPLRASGQNPGQGCSRQTRQAKALHRVCVRLCPIRPSVLQGSLNIDMLSGSL